MKKYHEQDNSLCLSHFYRSLRNAFRGLKLLFKYEYNLYREITLAFFAIILGFYFSLSEGEWLALVLVIGLVIFAEITNTVSERIMDFVHPDYHLEVGKIKDLAAGAVLFTSFISLVIACIIFLPKIFS